MIDLAIIGGGPAGTAAALEARRRGMSVAIWERDRFPHDKVCGEFISPEAIPVLADEIPATLGRAALIRGAEFISRRGRPWRFDLPDPALGLSRGVLDHALWQSVLGRGAEAFEGAVVRDVFRGSEFPARFIVRSSPVGVHVDEGAERTWDAKALLVACGRWWTIAGLASPARESGRVGPWVGAKAHFGGISARGAVEMYCFPGGYCGLAPIEDGLYNACCLVHRDLARRATGAVADFANWILDSARHPALAERLRGATQVSETVTTAPVRMVRRNAHAGGVLFAGDAAGFLDPFTGDGIAQALHGGRLAAACAARLRAASDDEAGSILAEYARERRRAARRSYRVAGLLRILVHAPAAVQAVAAAVASRIGHRLLAETRWQPQEMTRVGFDETIKERI